MKITPLPSVEDTVDDFFDNTFKWVDMENGLGQYLLMADVEKHLKAKITQDRNQAYTRLVEGIEGMKTDERKVATFGEWQAESYEDKMLVNAILTDILKNVVNPLYGKE